MDSTILSAVIGGAATLATFTLGGLANARKDRAAAREAAQKESRAAVEALLGAAIDVRSLLAVADTRRQDWRTMYSVAALSVTKFFARQAAGEAARGAAEGLQSALDWRHAVDAADEVRAMAVLARLSAAGAKIAMLDSPELRKATSDTIDAVGELMAAANLRPSSSARQQAEAKVEEAVAELGDAVRAYDGRLRPPWWRRSGRWVRARFTRQEDAAPAIE